MLPWSGGEGGDKRVVGIQEKVCNGGGKKEWGGGDKRKSFGWAGVKSKYCVGGPRNS